MNNKIIKVLSIVSSAVFLITLIITCGVIWFYILPSAYQESVMLSNGNPDIYGKLFLFEKLRVLKSLSVNSRQCFISSELTAGMVENILLFFMSAIMFVYVKREIKLWFNLKEDFFYFLIAGFAFDLFQSILITMYLNNPIDNYILEPIVHISFLIKFFIYSFSISILLGLLYQNSILKAHS